MVVVIPLFRRPTLVVITSYIVNECELCFIINNETYFRRLTPDFDIRLQQFIRRIAACGDIGRTNPFITSASEISFLPLHYYLLVIFQSGFCIIRGKYE